MVEYQCAAESETQKFKKFHAAIKETLLPALLATVHRIDAGRLALIRDFERHTVELARCFVSHFRACDSITVEFIVTIHKMLYPVDALISKTHFDGTLVVTRPGEWRKNEFKPNNPGFINSCNTSDIPSELTSLCARFSSREGSRGYADRERLLQFYCNFIRIHPFPDRNGTVSALLCNMESLRYGCRPLNMLHLRFKDRGFLFSVVARYIDNQTDAVLKQLIEDVDNFHLRSNYIEFPAFSDDLTQDSAATRFLRQIGVNDVDPR